jgi:sensor histidine kinase regulating citrate/malate metabolism
MNHRTFNFIWISVVIMIFAIFLGIFFIIGYVSYNLATLNPEDINTIGQTIGGFVGSIEEGMDSQ